MKRPKRTHKSDRLLAPDARNEERRCDYAIAPFDRAALKMEDKWGIDRLPSLVSTDTAARYGKLMADLMDAVSAGNAETVEKLSGIGIKALAAMDAEAEANGADQSPPNFLEHDLDGFKFGIAADYEQAARIKKQRPDLAVFTMREAGLRLRGLCENGMVEAIKDAFPNAEIQKLTPVKDVPHDFWETGGDQL